MHIQGHITIPLNMYVLNTYSYIVMYDVNFCKLYLITHLFRYTVHHKMLASLSKNKKIDESRKAHTHCQINT